MMADYLAPMANHVWQSTLFTAAVWLITLALRKNRAAVRHRLWLAASVKFLIPFSLLAGLGSYFQWQADSAVASPRVSIIVGAISQPFATSDPSPVQTTRAPQSGWIPGVLVSVWICGFAASLFWWSIRWGRLRGTMRRSTLLNLAVPIRVMRCPERLEPGVFGIFNPVLLLPEGIDERLSPAHLQAVLAHELCHVRRRDNLGAAIHMLVEALFWFHPLVWWIRVRLIDEQERACDEEVLRLGGDPQVYAESILKICEFCLTSPLICVSGITGSNLKRRIEDIMRNRVALKLSLSRAVLLAVGTVIALASPIVFGIAHVKAVGEQSEPADRSVARPIGIVEEPPLSPKTAQLEEPRTSQAATPTTLQEVRGGARPLSETQQYRLGEIKVVGAMVLRSELVQRMLGLVSGEVFEESRLREGFKNLMRLYGTLGYVNFLPEPVLDFDEQRKVVNLTVNIDEGRQFTINRITFSGNTKTPDEVIRREIPFKEGTVFNSSALALTLSRLNQMGLFEEIRIEDFAVKPSPSEPKVDIELRVKEKAQ